MGVDFAQGSFTAAASRSSRYCTHDPYGGPQAGAYDLDGDGYPEWWQPGDYDLLTYPALGWDCDDLDPDVFPPTGC